MADVSISLNNIRNTKTVFIEDEGFAVTIRQLGAGEELDLSDKMRRLQEIARELQSVDFLKYDISKVEDRKEIDKLQKRVTKLSEEIGEIKRFELASYKRCFSDDANGANVEKLLNSLTEEARANLFQQVFEPLKAIEAPETVETVLDDTITETEPEAPEKALEEAK